ncbi:synaptotagmin-2 [Canna indica]|uniref:Synaptotagmin-2 n=1 Tax=Canna indica TaxID=4628 RepID=A0AAQ3JR64_9LILI|nr:synaptotagmin-2 [Canna indica]
MELSFLRKGSWRGFGRNWKGLKVGLVSTMLGFVGFGVGITAGVVVGFYLFVRSQPSDVEDPKVRMLVEHDAQLMEDILSEIPPWVKNPDYDRVDWLNKFVELMWPYLNKAICRNAEQVAEPIIAEIAVKYKLKSLKFKTFTLGSIPPTLHGMKVYTTEEKDIIMEPSLKWAANPNVTIVGKAYGFRLTAQVVDLQIFACPRVTLKPLVPSFPCFANIFISLMEKPYIDFGLKLVRADLMAIPGFYRFVQETIKNQVANMFLWPRTVEVQILDVSKALMKHVGILHVKVIRAYELRKKDLLGKSDPYVKLKLSDDKFPSRKTQVKHSNLEPEWNEEFKFVIKDPENQFVELNVYDWERVGQHDKIGMNVIELNELIPDEPTTLTLDLLKIFESVDVQSETSEGQIVVEVTYKPFKEVPESISAQADEVEKTPESTPSGGGMLLVIVHEAQDLEGEHHTNPYVKITFRGDKRKTKRIKKNRNPRWEEEFHFVCEEPPVKDKLHVEVLSKAPSISIHPKESLGYVKVSLADVVNNKRTNQTHHLKFSKNGKIQIELQWSTY